MTEPASLTQHREQLARVLAAPAFLSSRQAHDFLQYVCDRVFAGSVNIEQAEIARDVLGRTDFDPTTDASVRKLATTVRQRLEKYYEGPGADDEVVITLPLRSYAPHFEMRPTPLPVPPPPAPAPPPQPPQQGSRRSAAWPSLAVAVAAVVIAAAVWKSPRTVSQTGPELIRIVTATGDLTSPGPDAAPGALRLGSPLGPADDLAAEVTFRPEHEGQNAGLIVWEGPNRYVALSRRFTSRNFLTLSYQYDVYPSVPEGNEVLDIEGQSGRPVWLRLVRRGSSFSGWRSPDGVHWTKIGPSVQVALSPSARAGVFAVNGRRPSPPIPAEFRLPGKGPALPEPEGESAWRFQSTCPDAGDLTAPTRDAASWPQCQTMWSRDFALNRPAVWSVTTRLDAPSTPGMAAGAFVAGSGGRLRVVRYHGESPSISLILDGRFLQPTPDFPGSPPVYLRLRGEAGSIIAECSVDGRTFRRVSTPVPASRLGKLTSFGAVASRRPPGVGSVPAVRFFFAQEDLFPAESIQFAARRP